MTQMRKTTRKTGRARAAFAGGIAEGASVRTPCGERRIEMVRAGDLVVTRDHGLQPVRMVLRRDVSKASIARDNTLAPVCLGPRAIGPMMPRKPVWLAPEHRLLVPGYRLNGARNKENGLIKARELAGASDAVHVVQSARGVSYFTIVFDEHELFCVNGLPVESYLPSATALERLNSRLRRDIVRLFPKPEEEPNAYPAAGYRTVSGADYLPEHA